MQPTLKTEFPKGPDGGRFALLQPLTALGFLIWLTFVIGDVSCKVPLRFMDADLTAPMYHRGTCETVLLSQHQIVKDMHFATDATA